jgi:peptidoglycan/xylan/chitin deacetylase (PgdA/CDA1 family)
VASLADRLAHRLGAHWPVAPFRPRLARPLVSVSFDDAPVSAAERGAAMVEATGGRATFYIAAGLLGAVEPAFPIMERKAVAELARRGHEIGCHTFHHRPVSALGAEGLAAEARLNAEAMRALVPGLPLENFAYPLGVVRLAAKRRAASLYRSSRGIHRGLNRGLIDLQHLRAEPLVDGLNGRGDLDVLLDAVMAQCGWLILYTHDIAERPSPFGATPGLLAHLLEGAARRGLPVLPVGAALDEIGAPRGPALAAPPAKAAA